MRSYGGRTVHVHLPPGYDPARRDKYPLLLLHDGQNLFEAGKEPLETEPPSVMEPAFAEAPARLAEAPSARRRPEPVDGPPDTPIVKPPAKVFRPAQSWRVDETVDRLVGARQIPPVVAAGIEHADERRIVEFTPTPGGIPDAGRAREYSRLVMNEVIPGLAQDFHVRTDAAGLTLGGSSMGGLITLWLAATQPGKFGRLIVMSPSVWWDDRVILRQLRTRGLEPPPRVWLDVGKKEGAVVLRDVRTLRDLLRTNPRLHLKYVEDEHGDHSEASWGRHLADALAWIYSAELPLSARLRPRSPEPAPSLRRAGKR